MANKNTRSLSYRKGLKDNLFKKISQASSGAYPDTELKAIATDFQVGEAATYGTSSFYDFTKAENRKDKIKICTGSACLTARTQKPVKEHLKNTFNEKEIGHAACVGHCHTNHAVLYHGKTFSLDNVDIQDVLNDKINSNNTYFVGNDGSDILTGAVKNLVSYYSLAQTFYKKSQEVIQELKNSNLRGRGGAGFPFWFKLDAVIKENAEQKYIVCNADEGDPGAYSDMYLLEQQPHKVLFGMYMAGLTVGADTGVLYIRGEYPQSIRAIENAIKELDYQKLTKGFQWRIIEGQGAYVCGEETALLSSIEGLRPEVRVRPPYPAQYGLYGKPTVLSNVETFANIHWILKNGGKSYAEIGTEKSTGTKLVSLDSHFNRPGIYEVAMGTPVNEVVEKLGQGFNKSIKAVQIGGPLGGIVPVKLFSKLTLDFESFTQNGFLLGHASLVSIPEGFPMIEYLEHLMKFTADESCGKCFPCRIGSYRGYEMLVKAQNENYKIDKQLFDDLLETLELGSLCALGGGLPLPVKNALQYFNEELKQYFK
jgi:NADH-quinone oxidoreductase subunit F